MLSPWTSPPSGAATLLSEDGRSGLIVAELAGGEDTAPRQAQELVDDINATVLPDHDGVTVLAGGSAMVFSQINSQTQRDVLVMEAIAVPLSFLVLVWVFKGLLAALLPIAVGALAIVGSMSVLRAVATVTDVSIFALNLTTALGLALAIDYTLLIISRYRDEIAGGADRDDALFTTMATAGRTVLFSALTVALSMAAMVLFPMYFLKSFAYAGVATVALCATAAVVVTPAAIVLLGARLDALDVRNLMRRGRHRATRTGRADVLVPVDEVRDAPSGRGRGGGHRGVAGASGCRSSGWPGASPMTGCCRSPRRPIRSVTCCAASSPIAPRPP